MGFTRRQEVPLKGGTCTRFKTSIESNRHTASQVQKALEKKSKSVDAIRLKPVALTTAQLLRVCALQLEDRLQRNGAMSCVALHPSKYDIMFD